MAAPVPHLDKIDPAGAWQPLRPSASDPWGRKWAAHLYRRAAFGCGRAELKEAERLGPQGTLDLLLQGRPQATDVREALIDAGRVTARHGVEQLRGAGLQERRDVLGGRRGAEENDERRDEEHRGPPPADDTRRRTPPR